MTNFVKKQFSTVELEPRKPSVSCNIGRHRSTWCIHARGRSGDVRWVRWATAREKIGGWCHNVFGPSIVLCRPICYFSCYFSMYSYFSANSCATRAISAVAELLVFFRSNAIDKGRSVCPSVCHIREPRLHGWRYRNARTMTLKRGTLSKAKSWPILI